MPTGFTHKIHAGVPGFGIREYAEAMLTQFGAFIMNRDDDPGTVGRTPKLEDTTFHEEARRTALQNILRGPAREDYDRMVAEHAERKAGEAERHARLNTFRAELSKVAPPGDDDLSGLYQLMMDQLFKVDLEGCDGYAYWRDRPVPTFEEWCSKTMEDYHRDAAYHTEQIREIAKRNAARIAWAEKACAWIDTLPSGKEPNA